jgi:hypothetical protein
MIQVDKRGNVGCILDLPDPPRIVVLLPANALQQQGLNGAESGSLLVIDSKSSFYKPTPPFFPTTPNLPSPNNSKSTNTSASIPPSATAIKTAQHPNPSPTGSEPSTETAPSRWIRIPALIPPQHPRGSR